MNHIVSRIGYLFLIVVSAATALPTPLIAQESEEDSDPTLEVQQFLEQSGRSTEEEIESVEDTNAGALVPQIYVEDLRVTQTGSHLSGTFTVTNSEAQAVGDIRYEIVVLGPLPGDPTVDMVADTAPVYDRVLQPDILTMAPYASQTVTFSYTAPPVPAGDYRLQVQLTTSNNRDMGWDEAPITLDGASAFALAEQQIVEVESVDVTTNQKKTSWHPLEGVNVNAGQSITLKAVFRNVGTKPLTGIPTLKTRRLLASGMPETITTDKPFTIAAGAAKPFSWSLPALSDAGSYTARLALVGEDGKPLSNLTDFRYVVRGLSASVVSARLVELGKKQGEPAVVEFSVVGPADRETTAEGMLEIAITDEGGQVIGTVQEKVNLNMGVVTGKATVPLSRPIVNPHITVTLRSLSGEVLDTYATHLKNITPDDFAQVSSRFPLWLAVIVLLAVIAAGIVWWRRKRLPSLPSATAGMAVLIVAVAASAFIAQSVTAKGRGEVHYLYQSNSPGYGPIDVGVFVNQPTHNQIYTDAVPYAIRVVWAACNNSVATANLYVHVFPGVNIQPKYQPRSASDDNDIHDFESLCAVYPTLSWREQLLFRLRFWWADRLLRRCPNSSPRPSPSVSPSDVATPSVRPSGRWRLIHRPNLGQQSGGIFTHSWRRVLPLSFFPEGTAAATFRTTFSNYIDHDGPQWAYAMRKVFTVVYLTSATPTPTDSGTLPECSDTIDNADTEDTLADIADPGCHTDRNPANSSSYDPNDTDERDSSGGLPECSDTVDNADPEDTLADIADPGCHTDGNATVPTTYDPNDNDETHTNVCSDGIDNDGDGRIDCQPGNSDPGCYTDVTNPNTCDPNNPSEQDPQCSDDIDNGDTEDTLADIADPGCHTDGNPENSATYDPNDDDESNTITQCSDGIDNDGDGRIDCQPGNSDPGCYTTPGDENSCNPNNPIETPPQCSDGIDNGDNEDTLPDETDPGCHTDGDPNDGDNTYNRDDNDERDINIGPIIER